MPRVRVGCSGWHYRDWRGRFYASDAPTSAWLGLYSQHFDCVEINNSFYRLPERSTFERWRDTVPARFRFAVKASRYVTHIVRPSCSSTTIVTPMQWPTPPCFARCCGAAWRSDGAC